jgi:hypothetical protein
MAIITSFSEGMVMTLSFHTFDVTFDVLDFEKPWLVYRLEEESQIATKITTITLMQDVKNIRGHLLSSISSLTIKNLPRPHIFK